MNFLEKIKILRKENNLIVFISRKNMSFFDFFFKKEEKLFDYFIGLNGTFIYTSQNRKKKILDESFPITFIKEILNDIKEINGIIYNYSLNHRFTNNYAFQVVKISKENNYDDSFFDVEEDIVQKILQISIKLNERIVDHFSNFLIDFYGNKFKIQKINEETIDINFKTSSISFFLNEILKENFKNKDDMHIYIDSLYYEKLLNDFPHFYVSTDFVNKYKGNKQNQLNSTQIFDIKKNI